MHYMKYHDSSQKWLVGYFEPADDGLEIWTSIVAMDTQLAAACYVNFLNGGSGELPPLVIRAAIKDREIIREAIRNSEND